MNKNALLSAGLLLAILTGPAWAKEGTVVQNPDGTWGCVDKYGDPIPAGANGRWEGKTVVGSPCRPARLTVGGNVGVGAGSADTRPVRAVSAHTAASAAAPVRDIGQAAATRPEPAAGSFDAKGSVGLVVEPAGKSISEKGVSSTKSR